MAEPTRPATNAYAMPFTLNVNYGSGDPLTGQITLTYLDIDGITKTVRLRPDDADSVVGQGHTN